MCDMFIEHEEEYIITSGIKKRIRNVFPGLKGTPQYLTF